MSLKGLSIPEQRELEELARTIKACHEATCQMAEKIREQCNEAVAEAILCGRALRRAKRICGHGRFLTWLKDKCPKIETRTAQNYMRLANTKHVSYLETAKSLRDAYLMVGVIREKEPVTEDSKPPKLEGNDTESAPKAGRNGKATTEFLPGFRPAPAQPQPVRGDMGREPEVRSAPQPAVFPSVATVPIPATGTNSSPLSGSKRLHHLRTLVQSITDILEEITPAEEPAALEALRPIFSWGWTKTG